MDKQEDNLEFLLREDAIRAHQVHYSFIDKGNEAAIASGQATIKNLFLMHGGALVAMLTFTSGIMNNEKLGYSADSLVGPLMYFAIGLALATGASASTYLTNYSYVASAHHQRLAWSFPYVRLNATANAWRLAGYLFHALTVFLALVSLVLFVFGFWGVKVTLVDRSALKANAVSGVPLSTQALPLHQPARTRLGPWQETPSHLFGPCSDAWPLDHCAARQ